MRYGMLLFCMASSVMASAPAAGCFLANGGQWNGEALFMTELAGSEVWLTADRIVVRDENGEVAATEMQRADPGAVTGEGELPWRVNFLLGNDPSGWFTSVPCYSAVRYENAWPGVDILVSHEGSGLRFEAVIDVSGSEAQVSFRHDDSGMVRPIPSGGFILSASLLSGGPLPMSAADVELSWSTFLGGSVEDRTYSIGIGPDGGAYVTGRTSSPDYPLEGGIQDSLAGGDWDGFVTRFTPDGGQLVYSTYFGGSDSDNGYGIKIGSDGSAYVAGPTESSDFPVQNPIQPDLSGSSDAFVLKLSPEGDALEYSTYLGGAGTERGRDLAVDAQGRAHVCGSTTSEDFPVASAYQPDYGGAGDAFACRLSASGGSLDFSTYLGGSLAEDGEGIHVDDEGFTYLTGTTASSDFPVFGAYQGSYGGGGSDCFVTKLAPGGDQVEFSGFLGGSGDDQGQNIAAGADGSVFLVGITGSGDFPLQDPYQSDLLGPTDGFVAGFTPSGGSLAFSTFIGGSADDQARDLALSGTGNLHVVGYTSSSDFPTVNAYQPDYAGGANDVFAFEMDEAGSVVYSTYLGGSENDSGRGVAVDQEGGACLTGGIASADFPTLNPFQGTFGGGFTDSFVARLAPFDTGVEGPAHPQAEGLAMVLLSPNPTGGRISVQVSMPGPGGLRLELYDTSGRLTDISGSKGLSEGLHRFDIGGADPVPGVYILRAHSPEQGTASIKSVIL